MLTCLLIDRTRILFRLLLWISARSTLAVDPKSLHRFADFGFSDRNDDTTVTGRQTPQDSALDLCASHLSLVNTVTSEGQEIPESHRFLWTALFSQFDCQLRQGPASTYSFSTVSKAKTCIGLIRAIQKTHPKHPSLFQAKLASETLQKIATSFLPPISEATDGPEHVPPSIDNPAVEQIMATEVQPPPASGLSSGRMERSSSQQSQSKMLGNREGSRRPKILSFSSLTSLGGTKVIRSGPSLSTPPSPTTPQGRYAQGSRRILPRHGDSRSRNRDMEQGGLVSYITGHNYIC